MSSILHPDNVKITLWLFLVAVVVCSILQYCGITPPGATPPGGTLDTINATDTVTAANLTK